MELSKPDSKLNIVCFVMPLVLMGLAFFSDGVDWFGPFGGFVAALFAGGILLISAFVAGCVLLFKPSAKTKQAAWSFLFGFAVATSLVLLAAFATLSGQSSPWLH